MAHLSDMEELLATISATQIRDYMREAMNCYMASAYRGCVVLSYIALFDDLLAKLGELGKVNAAAKTIHMDATKRKGNQDVFESYLMDQLGSNNLISGLDVDFLTTLRKLRNKSAHPSGHKPSPEEARFIFYETITRFLSRPILSTTQLVGEIVVRLSNVNFFPTIVFEEMKAIVEEEISPLHDEAIPQLIAKLVVAITSTDPTLAKNSSYFLIGLALLDQDLVSKELRTRVLTAKSDDPQYSPIVVQLLSANGKLIIGLTPACLARIRQVLSKQIDDITPALTESKLLHPTSALTSIVVHLDEAELLTNFKSELEKLFDKRPYSQKLVRALINRPTTFASYFSTILGKAGSSDFGTANAFANAIEDISAELSALASEEQAFQLLVAVLQAASWGAFDAKGLRQAKFASIPELRAKAITFATASAAAASAYLADKLNLPISGENFVDEYFTDEHARYTGRCAIKPRSVR